MSAREPLNDRQALLEARIREALEVARQRVGAANLTLSEMSTKLPHGGSSLIDYRDGQKEILNIFEAVIGEWSVPEPLPHRLYPDSERLTFAETAHRIRDALVALQNASHEEHDGPVCPICVLTNRMLAALREQADA